MDGESPIDQSVDWDEDGAKNFLIRIGAGSMAAAPMARTLVAAGYHTPALLLAATEDDLLEAGVNKPLMRLILSSRQQQQEGALADVVDFVLKQKAESETLVISEPKTEWFNDALQKFNFTKDAAEWGDKPMDLIRLVPQISAHLAEI